MLAVVLLRRNAAASATPRPARATNYSGAWKEATVEVRAEDVEKANAALTTEAWILYGTCSRSSRSHTSGSASLGARQSARGDSDPPDPTFGPFGRHDRLNWLVA